MNPPPTWQENDRGPRMGLGSAGSDTSPIGQTTPSPPDRLSFEQVRIENTNRCTYSCAFCPRELLTRPCGVMSFEDFAFVLRRIGWHCGRVDLHGFGEPLLDPWLVKKVEHLVSEWPDCFPCVYTTLGVPLTSQTISRLASSGLQRIEISCYGTNPSTYLALHGIDRFNLVLSNLVELVRARNATGCDLEIVVRALTGLHATGISTDSPAEIGRFRESLLSLGVDCVLERPLHNYGRGRSYNRPHRDGVCSIAWGFRQRVLQVTWDLTVIPCCFDFDAEMALGNLRGQTLSEIFHGHIYRALREAHLTGNMHAWASCKACERCDQL